MFMDIHFLLIRALLLSFGGVLFTRFFMILDSLHWYFHIWVSGLLIYFAGLLWDSLHQSIQFGFLDVSFGNSFGQVRPGIRVNFGAKHLFELWDWGLGCATGWEQLYRRDDLVSCSSGGVSLLPSCLDSLARHIRQSTLATILSSYQGYELAAPPCWGNRTGPTAIECIVLGSE